MTKPFKRSAIISVIAVVIGCTVYLFTLGHYFLPLGATARWESEKLETWGYTTYPLTIPTKPANLSDALKRVVWKITRPGQASLLATSERLQSATPNQDHTLQEVLEAMGYKFPVGCHANIGDMVPGWRITHYPSMLRRIAKDLHFRVTWKEPTEPREDQSPNTSVRRIGASRSVSETNQQAAAAGSDR